MDYYKNLEINKNATPTEIKKSYHRLAMKWHPDKNKVNKKIAEEKFKNISEAYSVLSDPHKRGIYDKFGKNGLSNNPQHQNVNVDPMFVFRTFFTGNGFPRAPNFDSEFDNSWMEQKKKKKSPTVFYDLNCSLYDLYYGGIKKIKLEKNTYGVIDESTVEINIKKGWKEGTKITFENMQTKNENMRPGDITFVVKEIKNNNWVRNNDNLIYTHELDLNTALEGNTIKLKHINGKTIDIILYPMASSKEYKLMENLGMPIKETGNYGNLIIDFDINLKDISKNTDFIPSLNRSFD
jgi:DnaJ-class molecular chaperone